jgi:hypothetical protein
MRLLVIGCFALWVAAVAAQAPRTPTDHPATQAPATGRSDAFDAHRKTPPVRGHAIDDGRASRPDRPQEPHRRNIFGKMEADRIPHAGLSSDEEFFRRVTPLF